MDKAYRRTIDELVTLYELEPDLRDIYVEGSADKEALDWYLKENGLSWQVSVYEIDTVDVLARAGGNRARVIALAQSFDAALSVECDGVRCIADSDLDLITGEREECRFLFYTDYASFDLYFFGIDDARKLFALHFRCQLHEETYTTLLGVLQESFLVRVARHKLGLNVAWVSVSRSCDLRKKCLTLDYQHFVDRLLTNKGLKGSVAELSREVEKARKSLTPEPRKQIHRDDLIDLLSWLTKGLGVGTSLRHKDVVARAIVNGANWGRAKEEPLFVAIKVWADG